tara:strand:+ start:2972 stop:5239 length:2268 start_codon:yes stop_codon:yes gene_type:complete
MANTVTLNYSNSSGAVPGTLSGGEVAVNTYNQKIWVGNGSGNTLVFNHAAYALSGHSHSVGDGGFTQKNFTSTLKTKLDGIATSANNYSLPAGSSSVRGGFKIGYTESGKNYPVEVSSEKMYVNVPWTNTTYSVGDGGLTQKNFTTTLKSKLDGIAANANNYSLPAAGDGTRGGVKLGYTESGQFYPVEAHGTSEKLYVNVPWQNTTYAVQDGGLTQKNFTTTLKNKLDGIASGATNTAAPYYTEAIAVGDGGLTQKNFTTTLKSKLDGIAAGANNYSFPYTVSVSASNSTVVQRHSSGYIFANYFNTSPNTITTNIITKLVAESGDDGYMRHADAGSVRSFLNVADGANNYSLPAGSSSVRGGFKIGYSESGKNYPVEVSSEKMYVNVPWTDTTYSEGDHGLTQANFTDALRTKLNGIATSANNYSLPAGSSSVRGGFKIGYTESGKNYPVEVSSEQMYVNVPWTNTTYSVGDGGLTQKNFTTTLKSKLDGIATGANNYSLPAGSSSVRGGFKIGYTESGKNYPVEVSSEKMYVNVPWTNTTYSVGDGGLTQKNFTSTLKTKLDGIATGATANSGTVTSVATGTGLSGTIIESGTILLNLSALPDMTQSWTNGSDEFIVLDSGTQKRKLSSEIFGSNAFNSTTIPTNTNQLTNGAGFVTTGGVDTLIGAYGSSMPNLASAEALFGGGASGVTNKGISQDIGYKLMNGTMSVGCVTTTGGTSNEYLRYASGGTFSWDTIQWNHIQNVSALTALPS